MRRLFLTSLVAVVLATFGSAKSASAIEVTCIEASKYKYLYMLFGNDRRRLAEYLQVGEAKLPDGELCRAVLVTGRIEAPAKSHPAGQPSDFDKLYAAIAQNRGWLATIYLASGGGSIGTGLQLGQLTRMFWLKTEAVNDKTLLYQPDFIPVSPAQANAASLSAPDVPGDIADGWRRYVDAVERLANVPLAGRGTRCASACTFLHVAGIDRRGPSFVHRGHYTAKSADGKRRVDADRSIADTIEGMQRSEAKIVAHYRHMDAGEEYIRQFQATPTATLTKAVTERIPRYASDQLRARCGTDLGQLESRESKLRAAVAATETSGTNSERARVELAALPARRSKFEQCVAAANEKERLAQFAKFCRNGCDRTLVASTVRAKVQELAPAHKPTPSGPLTPGRRPS
jgi:hypothetical protein